MGGMCLHIGVGSNVVCSTISGNARSLKRWDGQQVVPTLCIITSLHREQKTLFVAL